MKNTEELKRNYWVWVTRPEYYLELDEDGEIMDQDRLDLDPANTLSSDGWWSCHKDTKKGDLILLYRSQIDKDIAYLFQAESDAYSILNDAGNQNRWDYGCDYKSIYKFDESLLYEWMKYGYPQLETWGALRGNFQQRAYRIPENIWNELTNILEGLNVGYRKFVSDLEHTIVSKEIRLEEELEDELVANIKKLNKKGFDLEVIDRQVICVGNGGRIDILAKNNINNEFIVIELKRDRAVQNVFGQIANYISWVKKEYGGGQNVTGIIIADGMDVRLESVLEISDKVIFIDYKDLGFKKIKVTKK